jgi:hypothetical protein
MRLQCVHAAQGFCFIISPLPYRSVLYSIQSVYIKRNWRPLLDGRIVPVLLLFLFQGRHANFLNGGGWWINKSKTTDSVISSIARTPSIYIVLSLSYALIINVTHVHNPRRLHSSADISTTQRNVVRLPLPSSFSVCPVNFSAMPIPLRADLAEPRLPLIPRTVTQFISLGNKFVFVPFVLSPQYNTRDDDTRYQIFDQ